MNAGHVILAIFLWLCIPTVFFFKSLFGKLKFNPFLAILLGFGASNTVVHSWFGGFTFWEKKEHYRVIETSKPDRLCLQCIRVIPFDANICHHCGKSLYTNDKKTPQPPATVEELIENTEVDRLINKIHQGNYRKRRDPIKALGTLGDKKAGKPLLDNIHEKPRDESTVPLILNALGKIGDSCTIAHLVVIQKNAYKYLDKYFSKTTLNY